MLIPCAPILIFHVPFVHDLGALSEYASSHTWLAHAAALVPIASAHHAFDEPVLLAHERAKPLYPWLLGPNELLPSL